MNSKLTGALLAAVVMAGATAHADELTVGPGKKFAGITDAVARAKAGDAILVYPQAGNKPYEKTAVMVRTEGLTIKAVPEKPGQRVPLCGKGFDYSGKGSVPRAIFQFDPQANSCVLEGFELFDAHNDSCNGAGVRINQANNVTVRNCEIHDCDMGIMSNGNGTPKAAVNQRIELCLVHSNGNSKQPGYNHNFYLGGTSVTLSGCEVHSSLTGHNIKSRAHFTRVAYCYIHDSANREFDLVDAKGDTDVEGSDAVLLGNIIVKDPKCKGNKSVIHFGQDGGRGHNGVVWLVHNTIVTPFISPVVDLSAPQAGAKFINNIIWDGGSGQKNQELVKLPKDGSADRVSGCCDWLSAGFNIPDGVKIDQLIIGKSGQAPPFVDPAHRDFALKSACEGLTSAGLPWSKIILPATPGEAPPKSPPPLLEYNPPLAKKDRPGFNADVKADLGAMGLQKNSEGK